MMPSTMTYQKGDILLIAFPQTGSSQTKMRPALVVLDTGDHDVVVARITTQPYQTPYDVALSEWKATGLLAASVVRLHKLATLEKSLIKKMLGQLQPADQPNVADTMKQTYGQW